MKKLAVLLLLLCLAGCKRSGIFPLNEVETLISEKGYTKEQFTQELSGRDQEDILDAWGEPNGSFSGLRGDIWKISEELWMFLYYDEDWKVTDVIVGKPDV